MWYTFFRLIQKKYTEKVYHHKRDKSLDYKKMNTYETLSTLLVGKKYV